MKSLVALSKEHFEIEVALAESGGEISQELDEVLQRLQIDTADKVDGYSMVMQRMDVLESFYLARAERLTKMAKAASAVKQRLTENLKLAMETRQVDELCGLDVKFRLVNSNPKVIIENEDAVDEAYKVTVTTKKIETKRIAEDLKNGVPVAGARLERGRHIREFANTPARIAGRSE